MIETESLNLYLTENRTLHGAGLEQLRKKINDIKQQHPKTKELNSLLFVYTYQIPYDVYEIYLFKSNKNTTIDILRKEKQPHGQDEKNMLYFSRLRINNKEPEYIKFEMWVNDSGKAIERITEEQNHKTGSDWLEIGYSRAYAIFYSTVCINKYKHFIGAESIYPFTKDFVQEMRQHFPLVDRVCDGQIINPPQPPMPEGGETDSPSCSNTGQFGGGGTPLKDIKLFLYANKVTKGTIKLSKPQVEVGTYATDWRPNPADATKSIEMMLKQIESGRKGGKKNGKKRD